MNEKDRQLILNALERSMDLENRVAVLERQLEALQPTAPGLEQPAASTISKEPLSAFFRSAPPKQPS